MWFGNIVTMRWWDDLWLNEAFAEFACYWAADARHPLHRRLGRRTSPATSWTAYLADQGPIVAPDPPAAARRRRRPPPIFDAITYPKGASVLQQLMTYVGEATFVAGMAAYFARHAWGNTTLQDLVDALAAASGRDLDAWRAGWLETAGTDRLTLEHDPTAWCWSPTGRRGAPRPHVLAVGAYGATRTAWTARLRQVEVQGPRTPSTCPRGADLYLVNDDDLTFAAPARPSPRGRPRRARPPLPTRALAGVAVATVWDMLVRGEATAADVVPLPHRRAARRDRADAWSSPTSRSRSTPPSCGRRPPSAATLLAAVAEACRGSPRTPPAGRWRCARLARTARRPRRGGPAARGRRRRRRPALAVLVRLGRARRRPDEEVARLLERDPDPDAWFRALAVRAARPVGRGQGGGLAGAGGRRAACRSGRSARWRTAFWRPGQDDLLAPVRRAVPRCCPGWTAAG